MRSFGGEFARSQKVSLAGKSRHVESREEVLERTRLERENRKQQKIETKSATTIQASWRAHNARQQAKADIRQQWVQQYGVSGEKATATDISSLQSSFLSKLCFFADPASLEDLERIAPACKQAIRPAHRGNGASNSDYIMNLAASFGASPEAAAIVIHRAQNLAELAIDCLALHGNTLRGELSAPQIGVPSFSSISSSESVAATLADCAMTLASTDTWKSVLGDGPSFAMDAVAQVLAPMIRTRPGLFEKLASILAAAGWSTRDDNYAKVAQGRSVPPLAETLVTNLVVRYISSKDNIEQRLGGPGASTPASLFCLPTLRLRCPSLAPLLPRLWRMSLAHLLRDAPSSQHAQQQHLARWLPNALVPGGKAVAGAILLGNLVEGAPYALMLTTQTHQGHKGIFSMRDSSLQFMKTVGLLLDLLPGRALFGEGCNVSGLHWAAAAWRDDDDEDEGGHEAMPLYTGRGTNPLRYAVQPSLTEELLLPLDAADVTPKEVVDQIMDNLVNPSVLEAVVQTALPLGTATTTSGMESIDLAAAGLAARVTCSFLSSLLRIPHQRQKVLVALAFRAGLVQRLWFSVFRPSLLAAAAAGGGGGGGVSVTALGSLLSSSSSSSSSSGFARRDESVENDACYDPGWMLPISLFSEVFSTSILVSGDQGLYTLHEPLCLEELYSGGRPLGVLSLLRSTLWHVLWVESVPSGGGWARPATALRSRFCRAAGRLMGQLHDRNGRRPFAPPGAFYAEGLPVERFLADVSSGVAAGLDIEDPGASRAWRLLAHAPYLVPFIDRARVFQQLISAARGRYRTNDHTSMADWFGGGGGSSDRQFISVRRGHVLEDAFGSLGDAATTPQQLRGRVRVSFINEFGVSEAGVDGGGLFKEFLEEVVKEGFNPSRLLFRATTDNRLYPNPHAERAVPGALRVLEFLGRMVGKALWEGILLELPLATFFLKTFRGAACDVDDLPTLDPILARNLLSLKTHPGDVNDLGLTFSVTDEVLGRPVEVDLVPGGRDMPVTSSNAALFVHKVADFKLNAQLKAPTTAFLKGFNALIPREWVQMFNDRELQELIGGAEGSSGLDLEDMKAHVQYAAGYAADHPVIKVFWEALSGMSPAEQADFLRFVTSCPRPPLLGFAYLEPPLSIQMAGGGEEHGSGPERLPTAATCINLLKLPPYRGGAHQMRDKLLYAIQSGAGFDLS